MSKYFPRQIQCQDSGAQVVFCRFYPAAAGVPTGLVGSGVAGVVRTSAGLFTITLKPGGYISLLSAQATAQMATPTDVVPQLGVYVPATATAPATITVTSLTGGVATDIAANANNSISVLLAFDNSEVPS